MHHRVSKEGMAMGERAVKLAKLGHEILKKYGLDKEEFPYIRSEMCPTCACVEGSVPNGCLQTQLDFLKSVVEGKKFLCHSPKDGKLCAGWVRARAQVAANPMPEDVVNFLSKWEYSPHDSMK